MNTERYGEFEAGMRAQFVSFVICRDFHRYLSVLLSAFISGKVFGCRSASPCLRGAKVLFLAFCLGNVALSQETGALIEGAVVNSVNGRQIPRAVVVLRDNQGNGTVGRADDIGRFRIKNVAPGMYFVSAERPGFYSEKSKLRRQVIDVP